MGLLLLIITYFVGRWSIEVTFQQVRAHLGVETQRQWSLKAIARSTPVLLGLFSLITLIADQLHRQGKLQIRKTAWYEKQQPTFRMLLRVSGSFYGIKGVFQYLLQKMT